MKFISTIWDTYIWCGDLVTTSDPEHGQDVGTEISEERVWECFEIDLDTAIFECGSIRRADFSRFHSEVQEILVNMMFNMGRTRLSNLKR